MKPFYSIVTPYLIQKFQNLGSETSGTCRGGRKMSNLACTNTVAVDLLLRANNHAVAICPLVSCTVLIGFGCT